MSHPEPDRREYAPSDTSLLAGLTPEQVQVVTYRTGPIPLIAAAGTTRTVTR